MEHHAPHSGCAFEGYYNKFLLPSGSHLVIVISKVNEASTKANLITLTYVPHDDSKVYQKEVVVDDLDMRRTGAGKNAFILDMPGLGFAEWQNDGSSQFHLENNNFTFNAKASPGVPWDEATSTPEGAFIRLPLPLHWHVQTLSAPCEYDLHISNYDLPASDASGKATVHQEKNWAAGFPSAHMWVQSREGDRGLCCAGGKILGMDAFLLGYRSKDINFDFRPPFALQLFGYGPFMSYKPDWEKRAFDLTIQSFTQKIVVHAQAPKGTFFPLSAPFPEGHRTNFLNQSFETEVRVKIFASNSIGPWRLVREDVFERSSLEFGAGFYGLAGREHHYN